MVSFSAFFSSFFLFGLGVYKLGLESVRSYSRQDCSLIKL